MGTRGEVRVCSLPLLAAQWHPTRNGDLTPVDVPLGSHKRIWCLAVVYADVAALLTPTSALRTALRYERTRPRRRRGAPGRCRSPTVRGGA